MPRNIFKNHKCNFRSKKLILISSLIHIIGEPRFKTIQQILFGIPHKPVLKKLARTIPLTVPNHITGIVFAIDISTVISLVTYRFADISPKFHLQILITYCFDYIYVWLFAALGGGGFNHASKRQCENLSLWREKRMYRIRPVSGYLLATYHDSRSNSLTIENLATGCPSVFSDSDLKDFEDVIGVVSDNQYLVSTRYGDAELRLLTLNGTNGAIREICRWDSSNLVVKTSMHCTGGVVHPNLTCAVNASRSSVVILGPTEANTTGMQCHGRPDPRQGIKCIHLKQDPLVIQVGIICNRQSITTT